MARILVESIDPSTAMDSVVKLKLTELKLNETEENNSEENVELFHSFDSQPHTAALTGEAGSFGWTDDKRFLFVYNIKKNGLGLIWKNY